MPLIANVVGQAAGLDAITGRATVTARTVYLVALTAAPTATTTLATMAELATAGYARQTITFTAPANTPRTTSNATQLTFGPFSADPPSVGWVALVSASSGTTGDFITAWSVDTARDAISGDSITVATGALTLSST